MNLNKQYVFVSGSSESGKSGGVNYLKDNYDKICHLKIRNVMPLLHKESGTDIPYETWQKTVEPKNPIEFWQKYAMKVDELTQGYDVVVMDTIYSIDSIKTLYQTLGDNFNLLFIDAPLKDRIVREYQRLRTDSVQSNRKADLSITIKEVTKKTLEKDKKKNAEGVNLLPNLVYSEKKDYITELEKGMQFPTVIDNSKSLMEFYGELDLFAIKELQKVKERKDRNEIVTHPKRWNDSK